MIKMHDISAIYRRNKGNYSTIIVSITFSQCFINSLLYEGLFMYVIGTKLLEGNKPIT